ncbi:MAG: hypothetical protein J3Q66DRAFT_141177 [Benniella sp.]|nr:MAG: hypothetical protein J3Q66DRAFT_141177 [Benniella sp.]
MCFGISAQEVESALSNTKAVFCNSTAVTDKPANLEQCVKALKVAVDTLTKIKKDGKRALNKDENIDLKKEIVDARKDLTQLQRYSGPDKAQKCFELVGKWRNGVNIPDPAQPQPQPQPPVHESERSVDSASISSGGSHSIPDQFYQASLASRSGGIDTNDEEISNGNTPEFSEVALNIPCIDKPRGQYDKHTGCFADAAPRTAHPSIGQEYVDSEKASESSMMLPLSDFLSPHRDDFDVLDPPPSTEDIPYPSHDRTRPFRARERRITDATGRFSARQTN